MLFNESFYKDPYLTEADAVVKSCTPVKKGFAVILDDTVFYPEGGGQPADKGFIRLENGEEIPVTDVKRNSSDEVVHYVSGAINEGSKVHLKADWDYRFSLMQNHSGEHIVSGLIHRTYGYENVGFHMSDVITIDISGELTWEQAMEIERKANAVIWQNIPVDITFPKESSLNELDYRSKKELSGKVRLVDIEGADLCACCGLHVRRTGEIGLIKLLSLINYKGGVRIEMVCGSKALADYEAKLDSNTEIKNLLSVKPHEVTEAVKRILEESAERSARITRINQRYFELRERELTPENGLIIALEEELDGIEIRKLCERIKSGGKAGVSAVLRPLTPEDADNPSFQYVIGSTVCDLKEAAPGLNKELNGRGGGSAEMIQGTFFASYDDIRRVLRSRFES